MTTNDNLDDKLDSVIDQLHLICVNIDDIQTAVNNNTTAIGDVQTAVNNNTTAINNLSTQVTDHDTHLTTVQGDIETFIEGQLTVQGESLDEQLLALKACIAVNKTYIEAIAGVVDEMSCQLVDAFRQTYDCIDEKNMELVDAVQCASKTNQKIVRNLKKCFKKFELVEPKDGRFFSKDSSLTLDNPRPEEVFNFKVLSGGCRTGHFCDVRADSSCSSSSNE
jgi:hypothetical protein